MENIMNGESALSDHENKKTHPWRLCPLGKHYVREHKEHIPPSKKHPEGEIIIRHAHCATNPLGKNKGEIRDVFERYSR